jgi:hypothetical protein
MEAVVMRAMAKQPAERFQRAGELGAALLSALIADAGDAPTFVLGHPSHSSTHGESRPTGQMPIAMPPPIVPDQPAAPPWRQRVTSGPAVNADPVVGSSQASGASAIPSAPAVSQWGAQRPSSLTGILPDLNTPFTSLDARPGAASGSGQISGGGVSGLRGQSGARSGQSGLNTIGSSTGGSSIQSGVSGFTDSQTTGVGAGIPNAQAMGRMPVVPPMFPGSYPPPTISVAPLPFEGATPMQPPMRFQDAAPLGPMGAMMSGGAPASAAAPPQPQRADLRATLPGSRMTEPPHATRQRERRSRLWIVIAALLIIMLIAVVVLLRWLEAGSAGFLGFAGSMPFALL